MTIKAEFVSENELNVIVQPENELNVVLNDVTSAGEGGGTTVVANPTGTDGDDLERIQIAGVDYVIKGDEVEANPTDAATETLTKISIDDTIYDLNKGTPGNDGERGPRGFHGDSYIDAVVSLAMTLAMHDRLQIQLTADYICPTQAPPADH